ncbi:MAG: glycosyltransferase family 4 protein [Phycisphaerae bacterium]|nr:glycosyltransferase family 4 protein [Phycisphaerae bacterium]
MKIGVVIERMEAWRGGAETSTLELCRLLRERDHDVHVITATNAQSSPDITIHTINAPSLLASRRPIVFAKRAAAYVRKHGFDIVHAIAPMPEADVYQPRGGLLVETMSRNVFTRPTASRRLLKRALLALNVKQRTMLELERRVFRAGGPLIACVSNYVARQCETYYNVLPPRARVIFNGVCPTLPDDAERARLRAEVRGELGVSDDTLLLLFLAHNFRLKGLYPLIETMSRLQVGGRHNVRLLVVGRDNIVPFQRRIDACGLQQSVTFLGPSQRAAALFCASDVCVHPTYYDPCSRVVLESLYFGVPAITTAFNGASEVIRDGCEGFVIQTPDDTGMWARRITDLMSPALRQRMSESALLLRERIHMRRHVSELEAVFQEIVSQKRSAAALSS